MSARTSRVAGLALCCLLATSVAAQSGLPFERGRFRFIGASEAGRHPFELLEPADVELLMELSDPLTPNEFLARGLPLRTSQLATLQRRGFLVQDGEGFRSAVPILRGDGAVALAETLAAVAVAAVAEAHVDLVALQLSLEGEDARAAFPAVASWMLRDAVWGRLQDTGAIDVASAVASGRAKAPDRGWWGVLWFSEFGDQPYDYASASGEDGMVQLVWNREAGELFVDRRAAAGSLAQFLDGVRGHGDGSRVRNPDRFPAMQRYGLVNSDGGLLMPTLRWDPESPGSPATAVEVAIGSLTRAIAQNLPLRDLTMRLRLPPTEAAAVAYTELQPHLVDALMAANFPVGLGADLAQTVIVDAESGDASVWSTGPVTVRLRGPVDAEPPTAPAPAWPPAAGILWIDYQGPNLTYILPNGSPR
jgi:hypothetical protein